jgi:hypothetical protein
MFNYFFFLSFFSRFAKTYTIEVGQVDKHIDISCKDLYDEAIVILHKNLDHVGTYDKNFFSWERHDLERAFLECGMTVKTPSLAFGHSGSPEGYYFNSDWARKCSYLHILDSLGKLNEFGSADLSKKAYYRDKFFMIFRTSPSINNYSPRDSNFIQQAHYSNPKSILYLKFAAETTYTIRVTVLYSQSRSLTIDKDRLTFKDYDLDQ